MYYDLRNTIGEEEKKAAKAVKKQEQKGKRERRVFVVDIDPLYNRGNNYVLPLIGDLEDRFLS